MSAKTVIYRKDYTPPPFLVDRVDLRVELDPRATMVTASLAMRARDDKPGPLRLDGEEMELIGLSLDGQPLAPDRYRFGGGRLRIDTVPARFTLEVRSRINPQANTALEGLYLSSGNYCTQCEAEGFRRITCYPDRPDVLAVFTTTIIADPDQCPVMLSNGNLVREEMLSDGRRQVTWHDPHPKPCYLFALVAGRLVEIRDRFTTCSGRDVDLFIYVEERNRDKCGHAMTSLKKAMRWDEEMYGREYDLDRYMIVAVDDFNMGAMENKGLNVFNSKYVLARPETATDTDYEGIEGVIAHEYFHNWTGNRVTCRDWFQLSLKEGLTVFRDQQFSGDMGSRAVKRIQDVNVIRSYQFREDSGPMAHPVRPDSFVEINNFYTLTVYNKGAEVIRMLHTLLGSEGFRQGMDLYFQRHDGQAVTCDDFVQAMADASGKDLTRFSRWYAQAGTPEVIVQRHYDARARRLVLRLAQKCPPTPGQEKKEPFVIPVRAELLNRQGEILARERILVLEEREQEFVFENVGEEPVCSLFRDFSAPVRVRMDQEPEELALLMARDTDLFNRWDAGQRLAMQVILAGIAAPSPDQWQVPEHFQQAFAALLANRETDPAFLALALTLPGENWIGEQLPVIDPEAVFMTRQLFQYRLVERHGREMERRYQELASREGYRYSAREAGRRRLRNSLLGLLLTPDPLGDRPPARLGLGLDQFHTADNMTDRFAALAAVVNADRSAGDRLLAEFIDQWRHDPLVVDKWLAIQASCRLQGTLERVRHLLEHELFSLKNPNKVRALISTFCSVNAHQFHALDGEGYLFLADRVLELDRLNPQMAARILTPLTHWRRYAKERRELMRNQLERISATGSLSTDVREIVERSLAAGEE